MYDDSAAIGKRYRRQDEVGTPLCITIDGDTLKDGTVTVRERDSMTAVARRRGRGGAARRGAALQGVRAVVAARVARSPWRLVARGTSAVRAT